MLALGLVVSAIAVAGSLYLSLGMGLKACPLCFYQRTFALASFAVLALGWYVERNRPGFLCLLVTPLAWGGLGVAAFHEYLVLAKILECPLGIGGWGVAPAQSLAVFAALAIVSTAGAWQGRNESPRAGGGTPLAAVVLGLLMAWGCKESSPPLPKAPDAPYDPVKQPLDTCRRPFVEK